MVKVVCQQLLDVNTAEYGHNYTKNAYVQITNTGTASNAFDVLRVNIGVNNPCHVHVLKVKPGQVYSA